MSTLIAVIKDLYQFMFEVLFKSALKIKPILITTNSQSFDNLEFVPEVSARTFKAENQVKEKPNLLPSLGEQGFVSSNTVNVFQRPVWTFDGVLAKLHYAKPVKVLGYEGRFAHINYDDKYGWVLKDEITNNILEIFPKLEVGEIYSANHPDCKKIRKIISDDFSASELFLPLQAVEYVTYLLQRNGRNIIWPEVRPRIAGHWQTILKGQPGIKITIEPKTGSVIEYYKPDGTGWVGYTKEVHVDESIVIEGVGRMIEGEYRESLLSKEDWQRLQPVWIAVT